MDGSRIHPADARLDCLEEYLLDLLADDLSKLSCPEIDARFRTIGEIIAHFEKGNQIFYIHLAAVSMSADLPWLERFCVDTLKRQVAMAERSRR
jgi:hypothetical protein